MKNGSPKHTDYATRISNYVRSRKMPLGLFLAAYGSFYLSSVILSGWTVIDFGRNITDYPQFFINPLLPRSLISPIFFVTSFPALIIGTIILCAYSINGISSGIADSKEKVAILLTASGFTYQVIGAWPPVNPVDFPWEWQKQIVENGIFFAWTLYSLSLLSLVIGTSSLYLHSKIFHRKHPELHFENHSGKM